MRDHRPDVDPLRVPVTHGDDRIMTSTLVAACQQSANEPMKAMRFRITSPLD
jgi:hypothetical protein